MTSEEHSKSLVYLSDLDRERFGYTIAKAMEVTEENLPTILDFCRENQVEMLIARCNTTQIAAVQAMEQAGFLLMDTLVYDVFDTRKKPLPVDTPSVTLRPFRPDDSDAIQAVARIGFQDYQGHYHADRRLHPRQANEVYCSWAKRACESREVADEIIVAEDGDQIVGFTLLRIQAPGEGDVTLGAVLPGYQGRGIFRSCIIAGLYWFHERQIPMIWLSTLINNIPIRKNLARLGFEPAHACYTFHKWFDQP